MSSGTFNDESTGGMPPTNQLDNSKTSGGLPPAYQPAIAIPRKSAQNSPNQPPSYQPPSVNPSLPELVYSQKPFTDHTGQGALSIFRGRVRPGQNALLIPWSWQVYVTYGATAMDCGNHPLAFYTALIDQLSTEMLQWFRFDFLFLPGADAEACARHYRGEKNARVGSELALVPSYAGARASGRATPDVMIVWDRRDWEREGVGWLTFDAEVQGKKLPQRVRALEKKADPGTAWVGEMMDQVQRQSTVKEGMEREYLLAKELLEM